MRDGTYTEVLPGESFLRPLMAGAFPVAPPATWFEDPALPGPTPVMVEDTGRVHGHIATFDVAHIGLPGKVRAPRSRTGYAFFKTGSLRTAEGKDVPVGQLTLAGGHAPLHADAGAAVKHYDDTASAIADVSVGEDRYGIWIAGAIRPEATPEQVRALRASAPSGDWRPINGNLELVAVCQVNVPGFPVVRARVAAGAMTALVAAGAYPLAVQRASMLADAAVLERLGALESVVFDAEPTTGDAIEPDETNEPEAVDTPTEPEPELDPAAQKLAAARARRDEVRANERRAALRARVHA